MKKIIAIAFFWGILSMNAQEKIPHVDIEEIFKLANEASDKGDNVATLEYLNKIHKSDSAYASIIGTKIYYLLNNKEFDKALLEADKGLALKEEFSKSILHINKTVSLIQLERYDDALTAANEGLKRYPKNYLLWYNKAIALEETGKIKEAAKAYQTCITYNFTYKNPHVRLGDLCYQQGLYAQALMSYNMYLLLDPDGDRTFNVLNSLNKIASKKAPDRKKATVDFSGNDKQFKSIDLVLNSLISMNANYKTGNEINIALIRQNHALIEQLYELNPGDDFWGKKYIPFYKWIKKENLFDVFAYTVSYSIKNEEFKKVIAKNTKDIKEFIGQFRDQWKSIVQENEIDFRGKKQAVSYNYVSEKLQAIGFFKDGQPYGKWDFYSDKDGRLTGIGEFTDNRAENGRWEWYHYDGSLKEVAFYNNGKLEGKNKVYHSNGQLYIDANYVNNELEGRYLQYNRHGALIQDKNFKNGNLHGTYKSFFLTGKNALEFLFEYKNDSIVGKGTEYFANGNVYEESFYENGMLTLKKRYFVNGNLSIETNYTNNQEDGPYKSYYINKKVAEIGQSKNGLYDGLWKNYYENGNLKNEFTYDKGKINGTNKYYDTDGILHYQLNYRKNEVIGYVFYDKKGAILKQGKKKAGEFFYDGLNPSGSNLSNGLYDISGGKKGLWKFYSEYGVLQEKGLYLNNEAEGKHVTFFDDGTEKSISTYNKGLQNEYYVEYHKNGKIKTQGWMKDGQQFGLWKDYYIDGTEEVRYFFHKGEYHGTMEGYHVEGTVSYRNEYDYGTLIKQTFYDANGNVSFQRNYDDPKEQQVSYTYHTNKKVASEINYVNHVKQGPYSAYSFNGKKIASGDYVNGVLHGELINYYENGQIESKRKYVLGNIHGEQLMYYEDGTAEGKDQYVYGSLTGKTYSYHENGNVSIEIDYFFGKRHGRQTFYNKNGAVQLIRFYDYDKVIGYSYLDKNGKELAMIPIKDGKAKVTSYYQNGAISREFEYFNGKLVNEYKEYYESGKLERELFFVEGKYHKRSVDYFENGNIKIDRNYILDNLNGVYKEFYISGQVKLIENYKNNVKSGLSKSFDEKGKVVKETTYYNGNIIDLKE